MQVAADLGTLLSGLSSTHYCCVFDGGVHTNIIASKAPKGIQKENREGKAKGKHKRDEEKENGER